MELVKVCVYAEAYYSEATYEDEIWIKKSSYEKLEDVFPTEVYCGELDGKYSDVMGEIEIQNDCNTDEEYAKVGKSKYDGDYLEYSLKDLYENNNIDWEAEQKEINDYFDSLDIWEDVRVSIPSRKRKELMEFVEALQNSSHEIYNEVDEK